MKTVQFLSIIFWFVHISTADIPWNITYDGDFTYYTGSGYGACGWLVDAATEYHVGISYQLFTSANPNKDQFCTNKVCVTVEYNGTSVTVPVADKCRSCDKYHLELSQPAFEKLEMLSVGHVYNATWQFVHC